MNTYDHGMHSSLLNYGSFKNVIKDWGGSLIHLFKTFIGLYFMLNILKKSQIKQTIFIQPSLPVPHQECFGVTVQPCCLN